jgi:hypothetical protein
MKYIIATHSFLLLVDFEDDWTIKNYKILNQGYHFGIALNENRNQESERENNSEIHRDSSGFIAYRGGKNVHEQSDMALWNYRANGEMVSSIPLTDKWGDIHQLASANNGLYLTNTKYNRLVYQESGSSTTHEYIFNGLDYDRNHLNSVFPCGEQVFVVLHNRAYSESEMVVLNHDFKKGFEVEYTFSLWNVGCHNIFIEDTVLFYNASQMHEFVIVDLTRDRVIKRIPFPGWHSKGLSVTDKYIVVGLSEHAFRDKRSTAQGKIAVIDRQSYALLEIIDLNFGDLPQPIGNVNEVRCVSGGELAQARSFKTDINWSKLEFAKRNRLLHYLDRVRISAMLPLRRVKGYVRVRI